MINKKFMRLASIMFFFAKGTEGATWCAGSKADYYHNPYSHIITCIITRTIIIIISFGEEVIEKHTFFKCFI